MKSKFAMKQDIIFIKVKDCSMMVEESRSMRNEEKK